VLQAVPENGVALAPFETLAVPTALTNEVSTFGSEYFGLNNFKAFPPCHSELAEESRRSRT
jgi:hypothetical protein